MNIPPSTAQRLEGLPLVILRVGAGAVAVSVTAIREDA
jgi:hypothetical protein